MKHYGRIVSLPPQVNAGNPWPALLLGCRKASKEYGRHPA